jgi:hypothetical protein
MAGRALYQDWREHSGGRPLIPPVYPQMASWARQTFRRTAGASAVGTISLADTAAVADALTVEKTISEEDASTEAVMRVFGKRLSFLQADMDEVRTELDKVRDEFMRQIGEVASDLTGTAMELRSTVSKVATGSVRWELSGLVLVGIGSVLSAFA